jgi:glycerol kinase
MKTSAYILSIDQGTTGSRAIIFDQEGRIKGQSYQEIKQFYPKPGWVEHDPVQILKSVQITIKNAIQKSHINPHQLSCIGITNQRESVVLWDPQTGKPYFRVIVWQDRRTSELCVLLKQKKLESVIRQKTGLVLDPYFSATKVRWMFDTYPHLRKKADRGRLLMGTIDTWLLWNMTREHVTDHTNASRTLLFNINTLKWDSQLLKWFKVPKQILPKVQHSGSQFGKTYRWKGLPDGIPITAVCGDQQSALFGQSCYQKGDMKNTYGTGCFLVMTTGSSKIISRSGLLTTLACDQEGKPVFALEGSIFIAGALIGWIRDSLQWLNTSKESEKIARSVPDSGGVTVIPAFVGLAAPYWDANARGAILGLTRGVRYQHIIRAALESIAFQTADLVDSIRKEFEFPIHDLKVDGGASQNNLLMQMQADLLGVRILRSDQTESTAWGAAKLAGLTYGVWKSPTRVDAKRKFQSFFPKMKKKKQLALLKHWQEQVQRVLTNSSGT